MQPIQKIALIKETIHKQEKRCALTPDDAAELLQKYPGLDIVVEKSERRIFSDEEFKDKGITVVPKARQADLYLGVKEVAADHLVPQKTYLNFAHIIKGQAHNMPLLKAAMDKGVSLLDYEKLADEKGKRLIGFGYFAGLVGAYYGLRMLSLQNRLPFLPAAVELESLSEIYQNLAHYPFPALGCVITGTGQVGLGAVEMLEKAGFKKVSPRTFLQKKKPSVPYFCQLDSAALFVPKTAKKFDKNHFYQSPEDFNSNFAKYLPHTDLLINGQFWKPGIPRLFEVEDTLKPQFRPKIIADISCDLHGSVPITTKFSNSKKPFFNYNPKKDKLEEGFSLSPQLINLMAIDNLPSELPLDASKAFSQKLSRDILPLLIEGKDSPILASATILDSGQLQENFRYLEAFLPK